MEDDLKIWIVDQIFFKFETYTEGTKSKLKVLAMKMTWTTYTIFLKFETQAERNKSILKIPW